MGYPSSYVLARCPMPLGRKTKPFQKCAKEDASNKLAWKDEADETHADRRSLAGTANPRTRQTSRFGVSHLRTFCFYLRLKIRITSSSQRFRVFGVFRGKTSFFISYPPERLSFCFPGDLGGFARDLFFSSHPCPKFHQAQSTVILDCFL